MDVLKTMKVGSVSTFPGNPWDLKLPMDKMAELAINGAVKYGLDCAQIFALPGMPDSYYDWIRGTCEEHGIELDIGATMSLFDLTGENAAKARQDLLDMVAVAKKLNARIMRRGYNGRLSFEGSRYNKDFPLEQHKQFVIDNLKAAEKILAPEGIYLAIENHCDFTGPEFAEMFKAVGSEYVGCAFDTGNGFTVFCDPLIEAEALAPYTITTHMKDMVIKRDAGWRVPFYPSGCALGDGHADVDRIVRILAEKSPYAKGLHLIVECGWVEPVEGLTKEEAGLRSLAMYEKSWNYLKQITGKI
ncbi:MAG: sugar phosphate isomerase/epimerase [Clostridia bacterium]|nr:sugar phosphate isomerase/epimerase [Clostridia bacterium]